MIPWLIVAQILSEGGVAALIQKLVGGRIWAVSGQR
jgi:hypothetical protein